MLQIFLRSFVNFHPVRYNRVWLYVKSPLFNRGEYTPRNKWLNNSSSALWNFSEQYLLLFVFFFNQWNIFSFKILKKQISKTAFTNLLKSTALLVTEWKNLEKVNWNKIHIYIFYLSLINCVWKFGEKLYLIFSI